MTHCDEQVAHEQQGLGHFGAAAEIRHCSRVIDRWLYRYHQQKSAMARPLATEYWSNLAAVNSLQIDVIYPARSDTRMKGDRNILGWLPDHKKNTNDIKTLTTEMK